MALPSVRLNMISTTSIEKSKLQIKNTKNASKLVDEKR
jgi:hypothetical protein